jgi:SAM-dependent methyltransferase
MRRAKWKASAEIVKEWNAIATARLNQIETGRDLSYLHIVKPTALCLCVGSNFHSVLDVGCGVGAFTLELANQAFQIVGIDISGESIRLARERAANVSNVRFEQLSAEALADNFAPSTFSLVTAVMSFSAILNLEDAIRSVAEVLMYGGTLIMMLPHPWFWAVYAGFHAAEWFNYCEEIPIEWEFEISLEKTGMATTFIHRPLELYCSLLRRAQFKIETIVEPMPTPAIEKCYPAKWTAPRFLGMKCKKL